MVVKLEDSNVDISSTYYGGDSKKKNYSSHSTRNHKKMQSIYGRNQFHESKHSHVQSIHSPKWWRKFFTWLLDVTTVKSQIVKTYVSRYDQESLNRISGDIAVDRTIRLCSTKKQTLSSKCDVNLCTEFVSLRYATICCF